MGALPDTFELVQASAPDSEVSIIIDSGWLVVLDEVTDVTYECTMASDCSIRAFADTLIDIWEATLPAACTDTRSADEVWQCFYGKHVWPTLSDTVRERTYIAQFQYDPINLGENGLAHEPETDEEAEYAAEIAQLTIEELTAANVSGFFSPACYRKTGMVNSEGWSSNEIDEVALHAAHLDWTTQVAAGSVVGTQLSDACGSDSLEDVMCNPTCPADIDPPPT